MTAKMMQDIVLKNKRVLIREDLNVPMKDGEITSDARLVAALPTIQQAVKAGAKVMVMSHLGRPAEGTYDENFSLAAVAERLSELLGQAVPLVSDWLQGVEVMSGQVVLLENVRFNRGEKANDSSLAKKMAALCDVYVMDAFATAHRQEASTCGVAQFAPQACMGPLMQKELEAIYRALKNPQAPVVAIVGGSKVSTKLKVLDALSKKVDTLIVGGGIANTFLAAAGYNVGLSLWEQDFIDEAERLILEAKNSGREIPLPFDVVASEKFSADSEACVQLVDQVSDGEMILDIGPKTAKKFADILEQAGTILWNGPVGAFEIEQFSQGTQAIAQAVANSNAFSVAGGGDTLAAIEKYHLADKISYISTGGGAFLYCLQGKTLPAVAALEQR